MDGDIPLEVVMRSVRKGIGNVHSHLINQNCLPKCIMRQQSKLPVWLLKSGILDILGGRHARDFFRLMKSKDLMEAINQLGYVGIKWQQVRKWTLQPG